jgi:hypothetical protein
MASGAKQKEIQRLSAGNLNPLANLIDHLALAKHFPGDAVLNGADPVIRSPHHLAEAPAMAQFINRYSWRSHLVCANRSAD